MGKKDISKTMTLKDGVSSTLNKISAGTVRYKNELRSLKDVANNTWSSIRTGAGIAAAAMGAAGIAALGFGIKANESAELAEKSFGILLKSKDEAKKMVSDLKGLALQSPFEFAGLQDAAKTLLGMGFSGKQIMPIMYGLGEAVAAVGGDTEQMKGIALAIGQIQSKGKLSAEEVNQLAERGVPAWSLLAEQMGKTPAQLMKLAEQGKLLSGQVIPMLITGLNKRFGGAMKEMSSTFTYTIANIKETASTGLSDMTKPLFLEINKDLQGVQSLLARDDFKVWSNRFGNGLVNIYNGVKSVANVMLSMGNFVADNWSKIAPIVYGITGGLAAYKLGLIAVTTWTRISTLATMVFSGALKMTPLGWVALGIGAIIAVSTYLIKNWETVKLTGMNTWNTIVDVTQWATNGLIDAANATARAFKFAFDSVKYAGISIWNEVVSAAEKGVGAILTPINGIRSALGKEAISVNFSSAKFSASAPTWDSGYNPISHVDFAGGKFSNDTIMAQIQKAQAEKAKKQEAKVDGLTKALESNANLLNANNNLLMDNNKVTGDNTKATKQNTTARLRDNLSPMDLADSLLGRIERHLYGT